MFTFYSKTFRYLKGFIKFSITKGIAKIHNFEKNNCLKAFLCLETYFHQFQHTMAFISMHKSNLCELADQTYFAIFKANLVIKA